MATLEAKVTCLKEEAVLMLMLMLVSDFRYDILNVVPETLADTESYRHTSDYLMNMEDHRNEIKQQLSSESTCPVGNFTVSLFHVKLSVLQRRVPVKTKSPLHYSE